MGVIGSLAGTLFGNGANIIKDTAEVFMENKEAAAEREAAWRAAALSQYAAEFALPRRGWFDRFMDGVNRLPRPALALGTLGLFVAAMVDPVWFAARMQGIQLVPEPLWWLMGAIVSFYFGARSQAKGQEFRRSAGETMARTGKVMRNVAAIEALRSGAEAGGGRGEGAGKQAGEWAGDWDGDRDGMGAGDSGTAAPEMAPKAPTGAGATGIGANGAGTAGTAAGETVTGKTGRAGAHDAPNPALEAWRARR